MRRMSLMIMTISLLCSCNENKKENEPPYNDYINSSFDIKIVDSNGNNLLVGYDAYTEAEIDIIYYDKSGNEQILFNEFLGHPKGYILCNYEHDIKLGSEPWIRIFLNRPANENENISETFIRFGNNPIDTLKAEWVISIINQGFEYGGQSVYFSKVWLNDKLLLDIEDENPELPTVVRPKI